MKNLIIASELIRLALDLEEIKLPTSVKRKLSNDLQKKMKELAPKGISPKDSGWLDAIIETCERNGVIPVQEDGTPWSGILTGWDGTVMMDLQYDGKPVKNTCVRISYHKYDSGSMDVSVYLT